MLKLLEICRETAKLAKAWEQVGKVSGTVGKRLGGKGWEQVGKSFKQVGKLLGKDREKAGKQLGTGCGNVGKRLGNSKEHVGRRLGQVGETLRRCGRRLGQVGKSLEKSWETVATSWDGDHSDANTFLTLEKKLLRGFVLLFIGGGAALVGMFHGC